MNSKQPERSTPVQSELIPHAELERRVQSARVAAERQRLARGQAIRAARDEVELRSVSGRPLSREAAAREPSRERPARERQR